MAEGYPGPYRTLRLEAIAGLTSAAVVGGTTPLGAEVEEAASWLHADHSGAGLRRVHHHMWPRSRWPRWRAPSHERMQVPAGQNRAPSVFCGLA